MWSGDQELGTTDLAQGKITFSCIPQRTLAFTQNSYQNVYFFLCLDCCKYSSPCVIICICVIISSFTIGPPPSTLNLGTRRTLCHLHKQARLLCCLKWGEVCLQTWEQLLRMLKINILNKFKMVPTLGEKKSTKQMTVRLILRHYFVDYIFEILLQILDKQIMIFLKMWYLQVVLYIFCEN